jgi:hypothetical protein
MPDALGLDEGFGSVLALRDVDARAARQLALAGLAVVAGHEDLAVPLV